MKTFEQDFNEGRTCFRTMVNHQVQLTLLDDENNIELLANCRDVSDTGVALEMEHPVDVGTLVSIHFDSEELFTLPAIDCKGRVLRCEQENQELFLLAIEIVDAK